MLWLNDKKKSLKNGVSQLGIIIRKGIAMKII